MNIEPILNWIRDWLGIAPEFVVRKIYLRSILPAILLPILIGAGVIFTWYQYRRETMLTRGRRFALAALRVIAYAVLLLVIFQPSMALEKNTSIPRYVGVLLDTSPSMAHPDSRATARDLADAALATGHAKFVLPKVQADIAKACLAMKRACEFLKPAKVAQALPLQKQAEQVLDLAARDDKSFDPTQAAANPGSVKVLQTLKTLFQRQKGLSEQTDALSKGTQGANLEAQYAALSKEQAFILGDLTALGVSIRDMLPPMPAGTEAKVDRVSRIDMAKGILSNTELGLPAQIAKGFRVPAFIFDTGLEPAGEGIEGLMKAKLNGASTRLGEAIERACAQLSGQPISGLVLFTDGQSNEGADPMEVARRMGKRNVPLYIVPLGLEKPKDVRLQSLIVPSAAFPKDKIVARLQLAGRGYDGLKTDLVATFDDKEIARLSVTITDEPKFVEIPIEIPKDKKGQAKLAFSVPVQPGEDNKANNKLESELKIFDQKIKVLYIEGKPRWEFRYLKVVLQRDTRLDVQFWMTEGDEDLPRTSPAYINGFPKDAKEAFKYDMVILGEVPAWKIQDQMPLIADLIKERSGSLLMIAGDRYSPASYAGTVLGDMLPVVLPATGDNLDLAT
ncbi:MAG: hypothetical protein NT031_07005, partial [Planctomycetota bacterium]|nr:hypothetical protein [Planctomycetota bacterium]